MAEEPKIRTKIETITPDKAKKWLKHANPLNRRRKKKIEVYARAMADGLWGFSHQGIAIAEDGTILDGEHRLRAVVLSGCTIRSLVTKGLPLDSFKYMDLGMSRTGADILKTMNWPKGRASLAAAIAKRIKYGMSSTMSTTSSLEAANLAFEYKSVISWLYGCVKRHIPKLTTSEFYAVLGRAFILHPEKSAEIRRFAEVAVNGITDDGLSPLDSPAILLRNYIMNTKGVTPLEIWRKTQRALDAFFRKETLKKLKTTSDDAFGPPPTTPVKEKKP